MIEDEVEHVEEYNFMVHKPKVETIDQEIST